MGKQSLNRMRKLWPAPMASAFVRADAVKASSVPLQRTRQGPDASQNANPNLVPGTAVTSTSCRSSTVLMKWAWPMIRLTSSGFWIGIALNVIAIGYLSCSELIASGSHPSTPTFYYGLPGLDSQLAPPFPYPLTQHRTCHVQTSALLHLLTGLALICHRKESGRCA